LLAALELDRDSGERLRVHPHHSNVCGDPTLHRPHCEAGDLFDL